MLFRVMVPGTLKQCKLTEAEFDIVLSKDKDVDAIAPVNKLIRRVEGFLLDIAETPCSQRAKYDAMESILTVLGSQFEELVDICDFDAMKKSNQRFRKMANNYRTRYSAF